MHPTALSGAQIGGQTRIGVSSVAVALTPQPGGGLCGTLGHRSKAAGDFAAGTGHTQATMRPFLKRTAPRKSTTGASWPERIVVLQQQKVVRRALAAPQRASRLLA